MSGDQSSGCGVELSGKLFQTQRHGGLVSAAALSLASGVAIMLVAASMLAQQALAPSVELTVLPAPPAEIPPIVIPPTNALSEPLPPPLPAPPSIALLGEDDPSFAPAEIDLPEFPPVAIAAPPKARDYRVAGQPAWIAYAVPAATGKARVALIIDDMGLDRRRSAEIVALPGPLTISFMTYASHLADQASEARAHGHELMMHMPMQPLSNMDAGPDVLTDRLSPEELRRRIVSDLDRFSGYVGVNNHMGSRFTANAAGMRVVMEELHKRGLLFIDSMTTGKSVGLAMAREAAVPTAARNVFLDDSDDPAAIAHELAEVEMLARKHGQVIAIGHPRDNTIAALSTWLPALAEKGLTLVPVTAVVPPPSH